MSQEECFPLGSFYMTGWTVKITNNFQDDEYRKFLMLSVAKP